MQSWVVNLDTMASAAKVMGNHLKSKPVFELPARGRIDHATRTEFDGPRPSGAPFLLPCLTSARKMVAMLPLVESKRTQIDELCRQFHVKRLELFGSAARGGFDPDSSDLDFLVEFAAVAPGDYADAYFSLKQALETLFGRAVDLVTAPSVVNPYLRDSINATRQPLYAA